jgi:hypothetical protein
MQFVFHAYPGHPWIEEWTFEPSGCNSAYRENRSDHFFRTQHTVGQLVPHVGAPDWALLVPVPQNSRINLLGNGFCAYFEQRKVRCGAEVLVPEPGVLWGRFQDIPEPVLMTDLPVGKEDGLLWVEGNSLSALLAVRDGRFCLVTRDPVRGDAVRTAEGYLQRDFNAALAHELDRRAGAAALFEDMAHHDSLAALCVESMMKALRPAEGRIPHTWSQSSGTDAPRFEINELFPLMQAWSLIDAAIAEELVLCALRIQTNAGALPVHYSPYTTYSIAEAPKPLMVKTAEQVWNVRQDPEFLARILPLLRRHLQWMLHHFDPKRRGVYSWKNQLEPVDPRLFKTDLATVDLAVLLLTEIEALNRLRSASVQFAAQPPFFEEERAGLELSIVEQFWNDAESAFCNAFLRDVPEMLRGFPLLTPLLWKGLPQIQKASILEHVRASENLPGQHSALSWRQSSMDDHAFPLLQQYLVFQALRTADPHGSILSDFSRLTIQGFVEWHTVSLESSRTLQINPSTAAFIMNVQAMHKYRYHASGRVTGRLTRLLRRVRADRTDLTIIAATALALFCTDAYFDMRKTPPPLPALENRMNNAYAEKNVQETLRTCITIMEHYPEQAGRARLLAANILMMTGEAGRAEELYRQIRRDCPDSPGAMISLGLTQQLAGRFQEAATNYNEFCYLFDEIFPEVVQEVRQFNYLAAEGFRAPPKWQEIYRYQFMHEL